MASKMRIRLDLDTMVVRGDLFAFATRDAQQSLRESSDVAGRSTGTQRLLRLRRCACSGLLMGSSGGVGGCVGAEGAHDETILVLVASFLFSDAIPLKSGTCIFRGRVLSKVPTCNM